MENYLFHTPFGCTFGGAKDQVRIRPADGKGLVDVSVADSGQYAGSGSKIVYQWTFYEGIAGIEERLLRAGDERYASFKIAKDQLFHPDYMNPEAPEHGKTLFHVLMGQCFEKSEMGTKAKFARTTHEYLELAEKRIQAATPDFKTVAWETVLGWLQENFIAPDRWENFLGLANMANRFECEDANREFTRFYDDFRAYSAWEISGGNDLASLPPLGENRYVANIVYYSLALSFSKMRETQGMPSAQRQQRKPKSAKKGSMHSLVAAVHVDNTREFIAMQCTKNAAYFELPFLKLTRCSSGNGGGKRNGVPRANVERVRRGIVFVNNQTKQDIDEAFPSKKLEDVCSEIGILERTMVGYVRDHSAVVYARERNAGTREDMDKTEFQYAWKAIETRMLHPKNLPTIKVEMDAMDVDESRKPMLEAFAQKVFSEIFETEANTEVLNAVRNVRNAYMSLYPALPRQITAVGKIFTEISVLEQSPIPKEKGKRKKRKQELRAMKERYERMKEEEPFKSLHPTLKYTPTGRMEQLDNRAFGTSNPENISPERVLELLGLTPTQDSLRILKEDYFSADEIHRVLEENGGEALIALNADLFYLKRAFQLGKFSPAKISSSELDKILKKTQSIPGLGIFRPNPSV